MTPHTTEANGWARSIWAASEPFVLAMLFASEGNAAVAELGVPQRVEYFAIRAAPLGRCTTSVVTATFHGFPHSMIDAVLAGWWDRVEPAEVVVAHQASIAVAATRIFGDNVDVARVGRLGDRLLEVCAALDTSGRPLAAANQAVEPPGEPWARLWLSANTLREYRGDAHVATLVSADLTVAESLVLTAAWAGDQLDLRFLRKSRQLDDELWAAATEALARRGLLSDAGVLTDDGRRLREDVEAATDTASSRPWQALSPRERVEAYDLFHELGTILIEAGVMRPVTAVGAPWPPPAPPSRVE